jgi:hypothetical protein
MIVRRNWPGGIVLNRGKHMHIRSEQRLRRCSPCHLEKNPPIQFVHFSTSPLIFFRRL